ncbi:hypothetical protein C8R44DRAFT_270052 [Mycena epipterygia]|nr:hypothetical protein C8R44DRAFT_270052 [Mycena epipterygia]
MLVGTSPTDSVIQSGRSGREAASDSLCDRWRCDVCVTRRGGANCRRRHKPYILSSRPEASLLRPFPGSRFFSCYHRSKSIEIRRKSEQPGLQHGVLPGRSVVWFSWVLLKTLFRVRTYPAAVHGRLARHGRHRWAFAKEAFIKVQSTVFGRPKGPVPFDLARSVTCFSDPTKREGIKSAYCDGMTVTSSGDSQTQSSTSSGSLKIRLDNSKEWRSCRVGGFKLRRVRLVEKCF